MQHHVCGPQGLQSSSVEQVIEVHVGAGGAVLGPASSDPLVPELAFVAALASDGAVASLGMTAPGIGPKLFPRLDPDDPHAAMRPTAPRLTAIIRSEMRFMAPSSARPVRACPDLESLFGVFESVSRGQSRLKCC